MSEHFYKDFFFFQTSGHSSKGTTRQYGKGCIHKQINAFERLLQHAMSRFSKENLYHMLSQVTKWVDEENKEKLLTNSQLAFKLKSVDQLRAIVKVLKQKRRHKSTEDELVYKHFELFLNDLLYLKDLKKYFDDEIYQKLQIYYHSENMVKSPSTARSHGDVSYQEMGNSGQFTDRTDDRDSGNGSQSEIYDIKSERLSIKEKRKLDFQQRFRKTMDELEDILTKWQGLLTEDTLELNDFDPDSYHELMQFSHYSQFESLLRLIPDMFAKCYKCIDLSKRWLEDSGAFPQDDPLTSTPIPDFLSEPGDQDPAILEQNEKECLKQIKDLQRHIEIMNKTIEDSETKLEQYNEEMNILAGRDERFETVTSEFNKIDALITMAAGDYQKSKTEQYAVASKLRRCRKGSESYADLKSHLQRLDTKVSQNHWKMKLLEFEKAKVQDDYLVEIEVRPSFIRFVGDTKDKIQDLENLLRIKKEEKLKLEKQLALTKTNTDRIRTIMRSYLGSASSSACSFDSSPRSQKSAANDSDDGDRAKGNKADGDSFSMSEGKEDEVKHGKMSPSESGIMKTPRLVRTKQPTKRDIRPFSEGSGQPRVRLEKSSSKFVCSKGPRAALKTQPKRVWEFV